MQGKMEKVVSLQSNIIINYIENSATEDDLLEMKKRIDHKLAKVQTRKFLDQTLTSNSNEEELLKNSILTMEKRVLDPYEGPYIYDIKFIYNQHIKIEADSSDSNIGLVFSIYSIDDNNKYGESMELGTLDDTKGIVTMDDKNVSKFLEYIGLVPSSTVISSLYKILYEYVNTELILDFMSEEEYNEYLNEV